MLRSVDVEEILREPLSKSEVGQLLARYGAHEFAPPDVPTLGAVVEATGADPIALAQMLAEIRGETFAQRLQRVLEQQQAFMDSQVQVEGAQESRLSDLERRAKDLERRRAARAKPPPAPTAWDLPEVERDALRLSPRQGPPEYRPEGREMGIPGLIALAVFAIFFFYWVQQVMTPPAPPWGDSPFGSPAFPVDESIRIQGPDGKWEKLSPSHPLNRAIRMSLDR